MDEDSARDSGASSWGKSKTMAIITTAVAVAVVFTLIIVVLLSPSMSLLASIRDSDGDGYADSLDQFPDDADEWTDLDGDGVGDNSDAFAQDAGETSDSDSDGVGDNSDLFPDDSSEWSDADNDGVGDNADEFPDDPDECSDSDSDGIGDKSDEFPDDPEEWNDADGDGLGDNIDLFPEDPDRNSPVITSSEYIFIDGATIELLDVCPEFPWDDLMVSMSSGTERILWEPDSEDLDEDAPMTFHEYETLHIGGVYVFLSVVDGYGDGMVSEHDSFGIYPESGAFEMGVEYTVTFSYEPTGDICGNRTFSFEVPFTPTTTLTFTAITNGVKITFGPVYDDISWDQISFLLSDGVNSGGWSNLTAAMLSGGLGDTQVMQTVTIGSLVVSFTIQDLSGNGKADQGDNIRLTATYFSSEVDYIFTVVYEPTDDEMAHITFSG